MSHTAVYADISTGSVKSCFLVVFDKGSGCLSVDLRNLVVVLINALYVILVLNSNKCYKQ